MSEEKNYIAQPDLHGERKADYETGEHLNKAFTPISGEEADKISDGFSGNIDHQLSYKLDNKEIGFHGDLSMDQKYGDDKTHVGLYEVISAPLAMYRIICMIMNPIVETEGGAGYKVPWMIHLKHKSGTVIQFREWKGAFNIGLPVYDHKELDPEFKADLLKMLELMTSDQSPHPYDGLTAGGVA